MRIGLVAGEMSGDALGAGLISELAKIAPGTRFEGVAGPAMQAAGCDAWESSEVLAMMGLIEPLREIPRLLKLRSTLVQRWTEAPPDVFVGIDAPDFNLGLEARLRQRGVRTAHYVSPSVWAWRQGRIHKIARATDLVLCLLPFEKAFYDEHGVAATFVGHPMADRIPAEPDVAEARSALGIDARRVVAVLPGSRVTEVSHLGPVFAGACARLAATDAGMRFVAPMTTAGIRRLFTSHLQAAGIESRFTLTDGNAETVMAAADVVLLASGTATLQAALLSRPMVAAYRIGTLTYAIMKSFKLLKVPYITIPNLLTGEPLVPEFIQKEASPEALANAVSDLLDDPGRRAAITDEFVKLRTALALGADEKAARAVLGLARTVHE
jgi:lipid-A-disaccharide synthase